MDEALKVQRDAVLSQFSLDDRGSALSRLVGEITDANGRLRREMAEDLALVRTEFSLDNENGAFLRLVTRVERAQRRIGEEFSLDNGHLPLATLGDVVEPRHGQHGISGGDQGNY